MFSRSKLPRWVQYLIVSTFAYNQLVICTESEEESDKLVEWIKTNLSGFLLIEYDVEYQPDIRRYEHVLELYLIRASQATKFLLVHKGSVNILRQRYPFISENKRAKGK